MRISSTQMKAMAEPLLRQFEKECIELMRTTWRDDFAHLDDAAARDVVGERMTAAKRYGYTGKRDLYRFINLSCYLGLDFESRPELRWIVDLLHYPSIDLGEKIERIVRRHEAEHDRE